jgi:hypothetical protein
MDRVPEERDSPCLGRALHGVTASPQKCLSFSTICASVNPAAISVRVKPSLGCPEWRALHRAVPKVETDDTGAETHFQQAPHAAFARAMMVPPNLPRTPCGRPNIRITMVCIMLIDRNASVIRPAHDTAIV